MKLKDERTYPAPRADKGPSRFDLAWTSELDVLIKAVQVAKVIGPVIAVHSTRGDVRLPAGSEGGAGQHDFSDPTFAAVASRLYLGPDDAAVEDNHPPTMRDTPGGRFAEIEERDHAGGPNEEDHGRRALRAVRDRSKELLSAIDFLESQARAVAVAVREGRPVTSGRGQVELAAEREHRRAINEPDLCLVCRATDAHMRLGLCNTHYMAWYRCQDRATGGDRGSWIVRRRFTWLVDEITGTGIAEQADIEGFSVNELEAVLKGQRRVRPRRHKASDEWAHAPSRPITALGWDPSLHSSIGAADGQDRRAGYDDRSAA